MQNKKRNCSIDETETLCIIQSVRQVVKNCNSNKETEQKLASQKRSWQKFDKRKPPEEIGRL